MIFYSFLQFLCFPLFLLAVASKVVRGRITISELLIRLKMACFPDLPKRAPGQKTVYLQASSVGETKIAILLARVMPSRSEKLLILSVCTSSGFQIAKESGLFDRVLYFPLDLPFFTERFINQIAPEAAIIIETEMWPRLIKRLSGFSKIYVANGRISDRSFKNYRRLRFFFKRYFRLINYYFARTAEDFEKARSLGVPDGAVYGNIKYNYEKRVNRSMEDRFAASGKKKMVLFGSIREKEELVIAAAVSELSHQYPECFFYIAPRHIGRIRNITLLFEKLNIHSSLYSSGESSQVVLVDEMGLLFDLYKYCELAFIGGSLYPYGGQNPIEAAFFAKPVLFGKYMDNFVQEKETLLSLSGAYLVENAADMKTAIRKMLADPVLASDIGKNAFKAYSVLKCEIEKMLLNIGI